LFSSETFLLSAPFYLYSLLFKETAALSVLHKMKWK